MQTDEIQKLRRIDKDHLWHPYTSMIDPLPVYPVAKAEGVYIELMDGTRLIDGTSSWWSAIHGYNNPRLNLAAKTQLDKMSHIMFGGFTHEPAVRLASNLLKVLPKGLDKIFYCDSGSVSVEIAIKMAMQYMYAQGKCEKNQIATIRGGYHGDTWHAMSVCDPVTGMHSIFSGRLPIQFFAPRPSLRFDQQWADEDFDAMAQLIEQNHHKLAAVIIEPIVQGAGGVYFYHPNYLKRLREMCDKFDILLIADEIATGFGRTGKMFACEWAEITPDIMCIGKALTGGYMSFAATIATEHVAQTISNGSPSEFMHGPTFMGNPLACAVAAESVQILIDNPPMDRVRQIQQIITEELQPAVGVAGVVDVRALGAIGVIELDKCVDMAKMQAQFVSEGVWIRPFGKLAYIMPPYIIGDEELRHLCRALVKIIEA